MIYCQKISWGDLSTEGHIFKMSYNVTAGKNLKLDRVYEPVRLKRMFPFQHF